MTPNMQWFSPKRERQRRTHRAGVNTYLLLDSLLFLVVIGFAGVGLKTLERRSLIPHWLTVSAFMVAVVAAYWLSHRFTRWWEQSRDDDSEAHPTANAHSSHDDDDPDAIAPR